MIENRTAIPITPRDFLTHSRDLLGDTWVVKLFSVGIRSLNRWTAKRPYVDEEGIRENPIEKYERLLEQLAKVPGGLDIARASVDRLAAIVGCELAATGPSLAPDKDTIEAECLDDYPALTEFHQAMQDGAPEEVVRDKKRLAVIEINQTEAFYLTRKEAP